MRPDVKGVNIKPCGQPLSSGGRELVDKYPLLSPRGIFFLSSQGLPQDQAPPAHRTDQVSH